MTDKKKENSSTEDHTINEIVKDIEKFAQEKRQSTQLSSSYAGADLSPPPSQEEQVQGLIERLRQMASDYTLGMEDTQNEYIEHLHYLNDHFATDADAPHSPSEATLKASIKKSLKPLLKSILKEYFERQREFNAELVKLLNQLTEILGRQRDFNLDVVKSCERTVEHYRLLERTERRMDDMFQYAVRIAVLEEGMEELRQENKILHETVNALHNKLTDTFS